LNSFPDTNKKRFEKEITTYTNFSLNTKIFEKCPDTGLYVGYIPGFPGAHSQGNSLDELNENLKEVIQMLLEDGGPSMETDFLDY